MSSARRPLDPALRSWLDTHAEQLCGGATQADALLPALARAGCFHVGVPEALGGTGGDVRDAILSIAAVAEHSLTAAFVFWGQRTFIEYLLQSPQQAPSERWLQALLEGSLAGATGLSNAMKYLSGIESLQLEASPSATGWGLTGGCPWVTNLRAAGFVVAVAVAHAGGAPAAVLAVESARAGLARSADLELLALRGSNTAALRFEAVPVTSSDVLHANAQAFLPAVRPAFVGLQCGLSIGLARAGLLAAREQAGALRGPLLGRAQQLEAELEQALAQLLAGVVVGRFVADAAPLFRLRIALAQLAQRAVELELHASGGRAYLSAHNARFARHWREAAFLPVVTPSITQLEGELARRGAAQ